MLERPRENNLPESASIGIFIKSPILKCSGRHAMRLHHEVVSE